MSKRLRDPVHGLIVFDETDQLDIDPLAWSLIDTPEFQRLRRIRQLGVSEFTFPGAVHSRFAHSVGVFHTARTLVEVIAREMKRIGQGFEPEKAQVALVAALLHDLGHGPFSHTFEGVQESRGVKKRHEQWTADIIRSQQGRIQPILEAYRPGFTDEVAGLLEKEDPEDIYHAVVSSSFDADRLDYLRRDKFMTGTGAGAIDFDWLVENVRVAEIEIDAPDDSDAQARRVPTFCLHKKALPAAEQFLLARYTLHQQVYFHKATRCVEHMIAKLLRAVAKAASGKKADLKRTGLPDGHPLLRFFARGGDTVTNYLALDDTLVFSALESMSFAEDGVIADTAMRLRERKLYKTLDLAEFGENAGVQRSRLRRIQKQFEAKLASEDVLLDEKATVGIYAEIGGDEERMHKKLHILDGVDPREISELSPMIEALVMKKKQFTRLYFREVSDRDDARG
ncbi:HD domain-containing protein [Bosea sp. (in: a-proteobacteria)]|uniref:HD domain-containing protein n=1 Tax=Bosea sp. (in: a-proteobacteria) TaxID=1871050 RepID=UPI001AD2C555|nr:HD domain-containing protein [Bosea sp. (in: a-proteobacteria)]MBN9437792.1 HD domain-containing protein [Bosea sp. (in: a-proteobacteria)]